MVLAKHGKVFHYFLSRKKITKSQLFDIFQFVLELLENTCISYFEEPHLNGWRLHLKSQFVTRSKNGIANRRV
jgi:hypothetical protein